jgi:hypothetical protein
MYTPQSALAVIAGEAQSSVIARFRDRFDPVAALGMPAHITILYPFVPPDSITGDVLERLRRLFASHRGFAFSLSDAFRVSSTYTRSRQSPSERSRAACMPLSLPFRRMAARTPTSCRT